LSDEEEGEEEKEWESQQQGMQQEWNYEGLETLFLGVGVSKRFDIYLWVWHDDGKLYDSYPGISNMLIQKCASGTGTFLHT
jgi:hypothetical protein